MNGPTADKDSDKSRHTSTDKHDEQGKADKDNKGKPGPAATLDSQGETGTDKGSKAGLGAVVPKR